MSLRGLWRSLLSHPRLWLVLLLWPLIVLLAIAARCTVCGGEDTALRAVEVALVASGLLALAGLLLLMVRFYTGIREVRDGLFQGDYEAALEASHRHAAVAVGAGFESALERLLEFDRRRAERVANATRLLNRLLREAPVPILIGDLAEGHVRFSRALSERFGVGDDRFPIDALLRPPANAPFARLWDPLVGGEQSEAEAAITLHLPVRQAAQHLDLQLFAVQNDEGRIAYILGFAKPEPPPATSADQAERASELTDTE